MTQVSLHESFDRHTMSVKSCTYPWHWLVIDGNGDVFPCSHGSRRIGNLELESIETIWNGATARELRASILADRVHEVCKCPGCPFQKFSTSHPQTTPPIEADPDLISTFDEGWYLERHPHIRESVQSGALSSGLEHFIRNGRTEGAAYRTHEKGNQTSRSRLTNAVAALIEFAEGRTYVSAYPSDIIVVVTMVCNLRCAMCPQGMGEVKNPNHTAVGLIARCMAFLQTAQRVILSGVGEPMLSPGFWFVIESLKAKTFGILRVHSNGHFMDDSNSRRILDSGLNLLMISLDAATAKTYRRIRGSNLETPVSGLRGLLALRRQREKSSLHVGITMTLMRDNLSEAKDFIVLASEIGVDTAIFSQIFPFGDRPDWVLAREGGPFAYSDQMLEPIREQAGHYLKEALQEAEIRKVKVVLHDNVGTYLS